jgi:7TM diverse intracellular signalling
LQQLLRINIIPVILFFSCSAGFSQKLPDSLVINTSAITGNKYITPQTLFYSDATKKLSVENVNNIVFTRALEKEFPRRNRVSNKYISAINYLKFSINNNADSVESFYFSAGSYFQVFEIYKTNNAGVTENKLYKEIEKSEFAVNHGYKIIQLLPWEQAFFLIKLQYVKTTVNNINPRLVRPQHIRQQVTADINVTDILGIITFIISGFFLMMIFYSFASYRQAYRPEFLYYGGYTFCVALLLFLKAVLTANSTLFNFIFEGYLDFLIQLSSVFLYLLFIRSYLNTKVNYNFIDRVLKFSQWVVIGAALLYTYIYFGTSNFLFQNTLELYTKYYLALLGIIFIITGLRYKDRLLKYVVYGNILLIFFGLVSLLFIATPFRFKGVHWIFNNSLMYYDFSVLGECLMFMLGLSYKNKKELIEKVKMEEAIKLEKERQEMEKQLTIIHTQQEERNRISADMHENWAPV